MADRGFTAIVVEDACTTLSEEMHQAALQCFNIAFGRVRSTPQVLELLAAPSPVADLAREAESIPVPS